ncbi:unnamed protein product [Blepharisma stoltei]|uniref:dual-specificity kinase n=1 Tax=Blepharisma stoltei TaxID=1481888 RepID=A0AAU9K606_9CILI|nr:unnamed protein product [Blepharisma stoltei]
MRSQRVFPGKTRVPLSPTAAPLSHRQFSLHTLNMPIILSPIKENTLEPIKDLEGPDYKQNSQAVSGSTSSTMSPSPSNRGNSFNSQLNFALKSFQPESPKKTLKCMDPATPTNPKRISRKIVPNLSHGLPPSRTSSASPTRSLFFALDHGQKSKVFPISPQQALSSYSAALSDLEKEEITKYSQIYYLSAIFDKEIKNSADASGMFVPAIGDHIAYRYEIQSELGRGAFGIVLKCIDHKSSEIVAVKLMKNMSEFRKVGEDEDGVLNLLASGDPEDSMCIVRKTKKFIFRGHLCLVFELLSLNLYELLRKKDSKGLELSLIKRIATQILIGLKYIHSNRIIHGDLKPENILLRQENKSSIKIIDFGSACKLGDRLYSYLQSRYYRAPEVILGAGYNTQIDMWSLGCILAELALGRPLFPAESQHDLLLRIISAKGRPPENLLSRSRNKHIYFDENNEPITISRLFYIPSAKLLCEYFEGFDIKFIDFIEKCLDWDPSSRITAESGLQHEWIKGEGVRKLSRATLSARARPNN